MRVAMQPSSVVWMMSAVLFVGCVAGDDSATGASRRSPGDDSATGKSDTSQVASSNNALNAGGEALPFSTFDDPADTPSTGRRPVSVVITNSVQYRRLFGHAAPSDIDFRREVVVYYSAGTKNTGGYVASIVSVTRARSQSTRLHVVTSLESPGEGCRVTDGLTHPFVLVRVKVGRPIRGARFEHQDTTRDCTKEIACGGFAGTPCPEGSACLDDPRDSCDPDNGGADCPGLCACLQTALCIRGFIFDSSPDVCACVPDPTQDPCAAVRCAAGTHCEASDDKASCVPDDTGVFCGGIAGIECPGFGRCADNPNDSCDPNNGGADCGGLCTCIENVLCVQGKRFDSSPSVCACVDEQENPCALIDCLPGTRCEVHDGEPFCLSDGTQACGKTTCPVDTSCCNASCSMCAPINTFCIQIACLDGELPQTQP